MSAKRRVPRGVTGPSRTVRWASYSVLTVAVGAALFPVFWTVSTSIKDRIDTFAEPPKFVRFTPTAKNYRSLFAKEEFLHIYGVTVVITVVATMLCVGIGTLTAYALARQPRFAGRRPLEATLILVRALPAIALVIPLYQVITRLGAETGIQLYDRWWVLAIIYAAVNLPFAVWLMTSFIEQIPVELEESAAVDGASRIGVLMRITLPLALPGVAATMIFVALLCWNEFLIPVIIAGEDSKTLPVYISGFISNRTLDWGPMAAASSLAVIPIALLTITIQRQLVSGLTSGAVKE